jgi:hypothetical protein
VLRQHEAKFKAGAKKKGIQPHIVDKVFAEFEPFARYGFNKAHATCYGLIAYQTAYLKANYPIEFMTAVLNGFRERAEKVAAVIAECRRLGIEVQDAACVCGVEGVGHLRGNANDLGERQRTVERLPVDVFHDEIAWPDVVEHADVRMIQGRNRASLLPEAIVVGAVERLDGHRAAEASIDRLVDLTHATGANRGHDLVRTKPVTWGKGHR